MAVSLLILLFVRHEVSYDRFHEHSSNIYRIATHLDAEGRQLHVPCVPAPLGPKLKELYPEILEVSRLRSDYSRLVSFGDKLFEEEKIYYAESSLLNIFTIKEIGIRKVRGASVTSLLLLLSRDFSKWVILANLLAWPIAYYVMSHWLQGFAYRIGLTVWIFLTSGVIALLISLLTISSKSLKAAAANPIKSLRYE